MNRAFTLALMAGTAALAACQNNSAPQDNTNTMVTDDANATAPMSDLGGNAAMNGAEAANVDQQFLTDAIKGDTSEVSLGQLAQQKGSSQGVKDFGQTLATDHAKAKDQATALAQQAGIAVPDTMKDEAKREQQKLQGLSGAAFDREFVQHMVEDHKKDIAKFEDQAKGTGPTAQLAKQTLPTLRKHLEIAQSLQR